MKKLWKQIKWWVAYGAAIVWATISVLLVFDANKLSLAALTTFISLILFAVAWRWSREDQTTG